MNDKLYKLYHWLSTAGLASEANSLSALIDKRAITLNELRREFPEASTGTMLPSYHGNQNISLDDWYLGLAVNLTAPMLMSKLAIPMMINKGGGVILNITSGSAERYDRRHVAYSTSKAALNRFTQNLAKEVSGLNIVVNALGPGLVKTEMNGFYEGGDEIQSVIEPALKLMALTIDENISGQILHKGQYS